MAHILTIGNSLADDAARFFPDIVAAGGAPHLVIGKANLGGCSLEKHWNLVEQCDLLPDVKPYAFHFAGDKAEPTPMSLKQILSSRQWDYVTLQQVTDQSWRAETYQPFFDNLLALVREYAPSAQPVVYQTWAYRYDGSYLKDNGIDQAAMHRGLVEAYAAVAGKHGLRMIPAGDAFARARAKLGFTVDPAFDPNTAAPLTHPTEPRSLIAGYHWRMGNTWSGKAELHHDYRHGSALGCYLAGAVWYEMFSGRPAAEVAFAPEGVGETELGIVREAAHEAVVAAGGALG